MTAAWSDPACDLVQPGVHRITLQLPGDALRAVNVYALETHDGLALIDSGWRTETAMQELDAALAQIGCSHTDVHDIYVTHMHRDHYTLALELRRRNGARVHISGGERQSIEGVRTKQTNVAEDYLTHVRRGGAEDIAAAATRVMADDPFYLQDWELPDTWMTPGPVSVGEFTLEAIATPGHTRGHQVFQLSQQGAMFTGDHVLPTITPSIGFEQGEWEAPLRNFLDSLDLMLSLPDAKMLPSHGWTADSVHERCQELKLHHEQRFEAVLSTFEVAGQRTALEVAQRVPWTRRNRRFEELDAFNQMIAVAETIAHLDDLADRGILNTDNARIGQIFMTAP